MQYFRFLPDPAKLRKEALWSGVSSVPGIGERVQPSTDVGAGTVTAYFVDNGRLGVLVRLELYPDKDGPDFHFLRHSCASGTRAQSPLQPNPTHQMEPGMLPAPPEPIRK